MEEGFRKDNPARQTRRPRRRPALKYRLTEAEAFALLNAALRQLVMRVVERAGIAEHVRPHDLRHAYAEHIVRTTDTRIAQHLLGHANLGTTDTYLGCPRIDDMVAAVKDANEQAF